MTTPDPIAAAYLEHHAEYRPVDLSFMGLPGHDHRLPPTAAGTEGAERAGIARLRALLDSAGGADGTGARLDRRITASQLSLTEAALDRLPRFANPAWYTGEAAFAIIGLLLPSGRPTPADAVRARLDALSDFLADGRTRLRTAAAPAALAARAGREARATAAFLRNGLRLHPDYDSAWAMPAERAATAFEAFDAALADLPDAPSAAGRDHIELLMRDAHGFDFGMDEALRRAQAAFDTLGDELVERARRRDPARSWQAQVAELSEQTPASPDAVLDLCRTLDTRARRAADRLVTPADEYGLDYRWLSPDFIDVAGPLYFLPYRSPPAGAAGSGSPYWITPLASGGEVQAYLRANSETAVKVIHAVHHGSIGHHTQNARARAAASTLARVGGTDCALGLAFLSSGTMVEGWACYVQDLLREAPGFYSELEEMFLVQQQRRNAASVLVDIRLHTGEWTLAEAAAFYRDEAGFAPARVEAEVTRNVMLPGTRLMYWLGTEAILDLRRRWTGDTRAFHDTLIGYGHVPIAWAGDEMALAGKLG
ncbi:DUF885 family protein [Sphingomonas jatrophae]|uniref:Uncharacterized conserved protein, DUF885 familyt n=1 Tax=Sphingomonas jatrophae TaxID=1166337 RepID=A0A1I6KAG5_9SPHN|nr:DUF885 family protein [Sphingomonas jatrophae]SFR88222.1 Uncharacterized conserved protein, DUF885 familyt [Sphingomonas jatrophae]